MVTNATVVQNIRQRRYEKRCSVDVVDINKTAICTRLFNRHCCLRNEGSDREGYTYYSMLPRKALPRMTPQFPQVIVKGESENVSTNSETHVRVTFYGTMEMAARVRVST